MLPFALPVLFAAVRSCLPFGDVFAEDTFIALQLPLVIGTVRKPFGETCLRVDRAGCHGDARLLTGGNDVLLTKLGIAENGDEGDEHGCLSELRNIRSQLLHAGIVPNFFIHAGGIS